MSDEKDAKKDAPQQLTDEQLAGVTGAGKFSAIRNESAPRPRPGGKPTTTTGLMDGVNNDTLFAGSGDDNSIGGIKGADKLKR